MKAAVYYEYGSAEVIQIVDLERPVPGDEQVVIRVRAASLNPADKHMMKGAPLLVRKAMGLTKPTRDDPRGVGLDVAGIVETVGKNVTNLKPGDEVFGACPGACAEFGDQRRGKWYRSRLT